MATGITTVDTSHPKWTSRVLDGQVYGEPLVWNGLIIVATENDSVYALSSRNGAVIWRRHLATAVPSSAMPCGNISPEVGITGTPVIDPVRREVFVLDFEMHGSRALHYLYGLDAQRGSVMLRDAVPTPTSPQTPYLNRSSLALDDGSVIFTFGGNYGDCAIYHGEVGAFSESAPSRAVTFEVDAGRGENQGSVWMGGAAPAVDASGHVWVETGNGSVTTPGHAYDDSEGVVELTRTMRLVSYFAPADWRQANADDADLSAEPALLGDGLVVATGKTGDVYLLRADHLGHVGGQIETIPSNCGDDLDGGVAVTGEVVYLPCRNGTEAVRVSTSPASIRVLWHSSQGVGPPIVAARLVWSIGDGTLYGMNPATGALERRVTLGAEANDFATPSVGAGLLLAPLADQVVAFAAR